MKTIRYTTFFLVLLCVLSCDDDYLNNKSNKAIVIPSTLSDLQALLDHTQIMNSGPSLGVIGSDDLFISDAGWLALETFERNCYTWAADLYQGEVYCQDWNISYQQVFYANVVLEGINKIAVTSANEQEWKSTRGRALFYRAYAFYQLAQLFSPAYDESAMGIPLKLTADVNAPVTRSTLKETYEQIIRDLTEAEKLLPETSLYKTRPAKSANEAMLARVYLTMEDYGKSEQFASLALDRNSYLLNYNDLSTASNRPVPKMNDEIVFYESLISYRFVSATTTYVDTLLYESYESNDLRKSIFFRKRATNRYTFKGNYTGLSFLFGGLANDEVYLTRAECRVRNGDVEGALHDLNTLLEKRWKTGTFIPVVESDSELLLLRILSERQKELVFRGTRWTDLKRLNHDARFQKILKRKLEGTLYTLAPNDARYVYSIPPQEMMASGITQNPR